MAIYRNTSFSKRTRGAIKKTTEQFITESNNKHSYLYTYEQTIYTGSLDKVTVTCSLHGHFEIIANRHLRGGGCQKCSMEKQKKQVAALHKPKMNNAQIISKFKSIHGDIYDYSLVEANGMDVPVNIICPIHGIFRETPFYHLRSGCRQCSKESLKTKLRVDLKIWLNRFREAHGDLYEYDMIDAISSGNTMIKIVCPIHGVFEQSPKSHARGHGCDRCARLSKNKSVSKIGTEWLDSLEVEVREFTLHGKRRFYADGYDPKTNTVYEFYGDYWHGNPRKFDSAKINSTTKKTFGDMYQETLQKENFIKSQGYNLVTIWESEYLQLRSSRNLTKRGNLNE